MSGYDVALFVHLVGAVTLFGGIAIQQAVAGRIRRAGTVQEIRQWMALLRPTGRMLPAAVVILLISGLYMTAQRWTLRTPWVGTALLTLLAMAAVGATVLRRHFAALGRASALASDGAVSAEIARRQADAWAWGALSALNGAALGVVWLMTTKPAWGIAAGVVLGTAILAGLLGATFPVPGGRRASWMPQ